MTKSIRKTGRSEVIVEQSNLYSTEGYTTSALSINTSIYKLCAVRKLDNTDQSISLIEFWNIIEMPNMVLELSIPLINVDVEACDWVDNYAICTATNGMVYQINPFTGISKSFQICPSSIWCIKNISDHKFLLGSDNGIIYLCVIDKENDDKIYIKSRINIDMETRVLSIAYSSETSVIGVGILDAIIFIKLNGTTEVKRYVVKLPKKDMNVEVIVWSLTFLGKTLVSGDSMGRTCLWNSKNGSLIKIISTHQGHVLALAVNGTDIFASGADYRIQVISALTSQEKKFDYATKGQRIIHTNDVRALAAIDQWLISGGAEHELYVSKKHEKTKTFGSLNKTRVAKNSNKLLFSYSTYVEIWLRADTDFDESKKVGDSYTLKNIPKNVLRIDSPKKRYITIAEISPNGNYIAISTDKLTCVYKISLDAKKPVEQVLALPYKSTSIILEDDLVIWSSGNFSISKYSFNEKKEVSLAHVENSFCLTKLTKNTTGTLFVGKNSRNQLVVFGREQCEDIFSTLNIAHSITGFTFIKENVIVVSTSSPNHALMLFNLDTLEQIGLSITYEALFGKDQGGFVDGLEYGVKNGKLIVVSENNWKIVSGLSQGSPVLESLNLQKIEKSSNKKCYIVPQWINDNNSEDVLFMSYSSSRGAPSNVPISISRYGRN
ncbi:Cirhin [Strongyloides ratti]|uniref:Cirhin n=1 Tax=Strongyloides ratti TaxID=34506 RepID=A0A090LFT3_STRRB|nr:Cirhin [Strongyloides ratti]CEF67008.1 Cirhin [Strongyloides ratti]